MIQSISDNLIFGAIKFIKHGKIKITNFNGKIYYFGENNKKLNVELKINKPGVTFNIIQKGSVGLAEAYMRGDFETNNLSDLIELTAKNITTIYKFSGLLDFTLINFVKSKFIKNTKKKKQRKYF